VDRIQHMDVTPAIAEGRQVIDSYGPGRFSVSKERHQGSIIVFPERTFAWPVGEVGEISVENLEPVLVADPAVEILLIGCGEKMCRIPEPLLQALRDKRIGADVMDTGAACRTFNVVLSEGRRVAAALIALP